MLRWAPDLLPGDQTAQPVPEASLAHPPQPSPDAMQAVLFNLLKKNPFFFFFLNWISLSIPNLGLSCEREEQELPFSLLADPNW